MTRSIFDPDGGETEQSGSAFTGPHAENVSHMPPDVVDGNPEVDETDESDETEAEQSEDETPPPTGA